MTDLEALAKRVAAFIDARANGSRDDATRDALLVDLLRAQAAVVPAYGRLVRARASLAQAAGAVGPDTWPAVPTDVFRYVRVASHPEAQDVRVFHTSGTTSGERGIHALRDLSLYDRAARAAAAHALFRGLGRCALIVLAPSEQEAPHSSLSYMLARFGEWFAAGEVTNALRDGALALDALERAIDAAHDARTPVMVAGTSFAFVHLLDAPSARAFPLPAGSRVMQTGGFKGRSREVAPAELRAAIARTFALPEQAVVAEYGMTELCSQMYETTLLAADAPRRLWVPGWMRVVPVDPETLVPLPAGATGILRIDDLANVGSVASIQTADLGRVDSDGLELFGRAPGAVPRGCSLAIDDVLGATR